jgi:hypothetical protein
LLFDLQKLLPTPQLPDPLDTVEERTFIFVFCTLARILSFIKSMPFPLDTFDFFFFADPVCTAGSATPPAFTPEGKFKPGAINGLVAAFIVGFTVGVGFFLVAIIFLLI